MTLNTPLSGKIFHRQGGTCIHCTKFEVSRSTRYEAKNGGAKCRKWGGLGHLGALKVMGNATIRYSTYDFLFDFNRNHSSILYRFRDIASYLSKVADFDPPHLHLAPLQVEFRGDLYRQETRVPGLLCGVAILVELRLVTDRHRPVASAAHAWRSAVKTIVNSDSYCV